MREQAVLDRDPSAQYDTQFPRPTALPGTVAPSEAELLPHPPTFKTLDVEREVSAVRDARKRIRLEPSTLANVDINSPQASSLRSRALPSICAYTLHDVPEGYVLVSLRGNNPSNHVQSPVRHLFPGYFSHGSWFCRELRADMEPERRETSRYAE
jgi:hypothetical protein